MEKKRRSPRGMVQELKDRMRMDPKAFRLYSVLRTLVIVVLVTSIIQGNYENAGLAALSLVLFLMPAFFEERLKIEIPPLLEGVIYLFIFAAEILGEVNHFYTAIPGWDTMLHTMNGFLCAAIGFAMVDLLNRHSENINLSPFYLTMTAFCFSMTIGVLWEFFEFFMDQTFSMDMQKDFIVRRISSVTLDPTGAQIPVTIDQIARTTIETATGKEYIIQGGYLDIGIIDTMKDLLVNFLGAVVFSVLGYAYVKTRDPKSLAGRLLIHPRSEQDQEILDSYLEARSEARQEKKAVRRDRVEQKLEEAESRLDGDPGHPDHWV